MGRTLLFVLMILVPTGALARPDEATRAKVRERIRTLRTAKLIELLDLDQASAARLFPVLNRYDDQLEPLLRDTGTARREIRVELQTPRPDATKLNKLIDRILANREKQHKVETERAREVRKVLTPAQMAKIVVVFPQVDRFVQKQIQKALKREAAGPFDDDL